MLVKVFFNSKILGFSLARKDGRREARHSASSPVCAFSGISAPGLNKKKEFVGSLFEMTSRQKIACLSLGAYFVISTLRCQLNLFCQL